MPDITPFKQIFSGLDIAYGTYKIETSKSNGKQAGKAMVIRKPPTNDLWEAHLSGIDPSLGIIPIRSDNSCIWGCIDIDQYPLDHGKLVTRIAALGLPLIVCRSKSGGAHVFLFTSTPVPAKEMQEYLTAAASLLGESGREIFPKQAQILVERGDTGNFLNLPYFGGDKTTRYAIKADGSAANLEEFYDLYEERVQNAPITAPESAPQKTEQPIKDGPPCLQSLCAQGFPEGTRNNGLFAIGTYLKKSVLSGWEDELMEYNKKFFFPPLGMQELQVIVKQLQKKEYNYKCKDAPINSFCNPGLCRTRKHGVGGDGSDSPRLSSLSKYASEPPLWFLDINGSRVELDTEGLFNQAAFQKACIEKVNLFPPTLRKQDWEGLVHGLLREMVETEQIQVASEDTSITGRFLDLLEEFCTHLQQAMDRDEMLLGRPWRNEDDRLVYFRIKDLEGHLKRSNFTGLTAPKMAQRLRTLGGEPVSLTLKGRVVRCWKVPGFITQDAPFNTPTQRASGSPF